MFRDPILFEEIRHKYALVGDEKEFKKTYSSANPEIPNENLSRKWDYLNSIEVNIATDDPMAYERVKYVSSLLRDKTSVLDLGFGSCNLEKSILKLGKKVSITGIDISRDSVRRAKRMFPNWKFYSGELSKIDLGSKKYDYVIALEVFEHISPSKVFKCYQKVYKLLKNNGYFIISVPLNEGLEAMLKSGTNPNAHVRTYTPEILKLELKISGFSIISQRILFAFHKFHNLKSVIARALKGFFTPNNIVMLAIKL